MRFIDKKMLLIDFLYTFVRYNYNCLLMKKVLILSFLLFSIISFSQVITVDTSTYTADGLVRTVLTNNSPCLSINNVSSRTGTNFGSTNGIGYFTAARPVERGRRAGGARPRAARRVPGAGGP